LDEALQRKLGRPYNVMLAAVLVGEIGRRAMEFPEKLASKKGLMGLALSILVELALLIHQIGELDHHFARRSQSKAAQDAAAR
jgi:hypothetical protein